MTPLRLLELFFDDVLLDMIVGYTKLYSHRERAGISFEITNEKIGAISFQTIKCIGMRSPILLCKQGLIQCLVIRSRVLILRNLHLCGNKFLKLLPVINEPNRRFLKFCFNR